MDVTDFRNDFLNNELIREIGVHPWKFLDQCYQ